MHSSSAASWSTAVQRASRSVYIQILNLTHFHLKLQNCKVDSGEWVLSPPSSIPPFGEGKLAVICSTPFTGADAVVHYAIIGLPKSEATIQFTASSGLISGRYSSVSISSNEEKNFQIRKTENNNARYSITWKLKTTHPSPVGLQHSTSSNTSLSALSTSSTPNAVVERGLPVAPSLNSQSLAASGQRTSSDAFAQSTAWQVLANVVNDTYYTWNLEEKGLEAGTWSHEPPMEIQPFSKTAWLSEPTFAGILGYAKYRCYNLPSTVFFVKWSAKVLSTPQVDAIVNGPSNTPVDCSYQLSHTPYRIIVDVKLQSTGLTAPHSTSASTSSSTNQSGYQSSISRGTSESQVSASLKVFRLPLDVLVAKESRTESKVPWLVESICTWLSREHYATRDLFVLGGRYHEIKALKKLVESGEAMATEQQDPSAIIWRSYAPQSVISLFKIFLRELPGSVVPITMVPRFMEIELNEFSSSAYADTVPIIGDSINQQHSQFMANYAQPTTGAHSSHVKAFRQLISEMPSVHAHTLIFIARSLRSLWKHPESVHTLDSIAITFAPLIAPDKPDGSYKSTLPVISAFCALLESLEFVAASSGIT